MFANHRNLYFKPLKVPSDGSWVDFDKILSPIPQIFNESVLLLLLDVNGVPLKQIMLLSMPLPYSDSVSAEGHPGCQCF